jgi:signal transduction histidine kinase
MGDPVQGETSTALDERAESVFRAHLDDLTRIAESVRSVAGADGALVSRVLDEEWLEVIAVAGSLPSHDRAGATELLGLRWRRDDLVRSLEHAERLGHLHVTGGGALPYVALPSNDPSGVPGSPESHNVLLAPLRTPSGELLGVLTSVGRVDLAELEAGACELVELYADQARLALTLVRENHALAEQLRMSDAAQTVLSLAAQQLDVVALLRAVAPGVADMLRGRGVWACAEVAGVHMEAASYPFDVADRLGPDICALVEPLVDECWRFDSTLTHDERPLLGRVAGLARREQALLASIGSGTSVRGALLVLRSGDDRPWSDEEGEALRGLGHRLGVLVAQLEVRRQDLKVLDELRQLDQYRRDLVASITHDLRTPLTAITINTELLESEDLPADGGGHPVAAIRRSAERLSGLVDDLLALARVEEGSLEQSAAEVDVVALVGEACRHTEVDAQARGVTVNLEAPDPVPALVDAEVLTRAYGNVVGNAVKYSPPGGEVRVRVVRDGDFVEMVCEDDGVGIPEDEQAAVFDIVRRSRDRGDGLPGAGIGLAISHRIVTRLGGGIALSSSPGRGSTFTVRVPVRPVSSS